MSEAEEDKRPRRSVSQLKQYERCPYSYKLARIDKVWQRPAAWLPQGSAVHTVAEHYEKRKLDGNPMTLEEAQELFREEYVKEVSQYTHITPNFQFWSRSGPYGGQEDIERRYHVGLEQVERLMGWYENHPDEVIWIAPDGTPGIELSFEMDLDGIVIRGFIDAVLDLGFELECEAGYFRPQVKVRDYKTGLDPGDDFQLGVYGVALEEMYDVGAFEGDYWMAGKKGKKAVATDPYCLAEWTREKVSAKFQELERKIDAEMFEPDPDSKKCMFCDVSAACAFAVGYYLTLYEEG